MTETSSTPLLEARALTRILHEGEMDVALVRGVSLSIRPGEFVSITGPSGSGKSSLLYLLGLLDQPTAGDVLLEGQSTAGLPAAKLSRLRLERLGFIFQFHFLLPEFTILDNVLIPMRKLGRFHGAEMIVRAQSILEHLGMADQQNKHPSQLSGGQRQRAAIARALANGPKVLLADEPTGNLDSKNSRVVHDIFRQLVDERQASVVMVTHDLGLAQETDRRIHLIDGRLADTPRT